MSLFSSIGPSDVEGLIDIIKYAHSGISLDSIEDYSSHTSAGINSLDLGIKLGILIIDDDYIRNDPYGEELLILDRFEKRRKIINSMAITAPEILASIGNCTPRGFISNGRTNYRQMLSNAKLICPLDDTGEIWWLELRWYLRSIKDDDPSTLGMIGHRGEVLSMDYEHRRLDGRGGIEHTSIIDGDNAGYDILSYVDSESSARRRIEVKASSRKLESADIHITWNEWQVARTIGEHEFHLWPHIDDHLDEPIIISVEKMAEFIPNAVEDVRWEKYIIPMRKLIEKG